MSSYCRFVNDDVSPLILFMTHLNLLMQVRFFLDDLISTLAGNKRTLEEMNSDDMLRVVRTKVEHFNKAFENDFVEFGYGKVSPSESLGQGKMSERQQIVLKKKLEFATKSPKSKQNTPLESTQNISIKSISPMASPRRSPMASPRRSPIFKTSPVEIVLDSPPPKIKKGRHSH